MTVTVILCKFLLPNRPYKSTHLGIIYWITHSLVNYKYFGRPFEQQLELEISQIDTSARCKTQGNKINKHLFECSTLVNSACHPELKVPDTRICCYYRRWSPCDERPRGPIVSPSEYCSGPACTTNPNTCTTTHPRSLGPIAHVIY